jgi:hypothetical protein
MHVIDLGAMIRLIMTVLLKFFYHAERKMDMTGWPASIEAGGMDVQLLDLQ